MLSTVLHYNESQICNINNHCNSSCTSADCDRKDNHIDNIGNIYQGENKKNIYLASMSIHSRRSPIHLTSKGDKQSVTVPQLNHKKSDH